MENKKRVWLYCSIDAPEDTHGALKGQLRQLMDYADQMELEVAGSSSDIGKRPLWERSGFRQFVDAVQMGKIDILLIMNQRCLTQSSMQLAQFQVFVECYGIEVYSPLQGLMDF